MGNWTPSIVPGGRSRTVYLVLNDFGKLGRSYLETGEDEADLETTCPDSRRKLHSSGTTLRQ
jgi:hypothetical protein